MSALFDTSDVTPIFHFRPYALQHVTTDFWYDSDDSSSYPYGEKLKNPSFCSLHQRVCLSCEDESWLPSQKWILSCCSGHGRKRIIGLTPVVSRRAARALKWFSKQKLGEFLFPSVGSLLTNHWYNLSHCMWRLICLRVYNVTQFTKKYFCILKFAKNKPVGLVGFPSPRSPSKQQTSWPRLHTAILAPESVTTFRSNINQTHSTYCACVWSKETETEIPPASIWTTTMSLLHFVSHLTEWEKSAPYVYQSCKRR